MLGGRWTANGNEGGALCRYRSTRIQHNARSVTETEMGIGIAAMNAGSMAGRTGIPLPPLVDHHLPRFEAFRNHRVHLDTDGCDDIQIEQVIRE